MTKLRKGDNKGYCKGKLNMTELKKELLKAIQENKLMDFIGANYWRLDKEDLKDIIKELDYSIYQCARELQGDINNALIDNLEENDFFTEE